MKRKPNKMSKSRFYECNEQFYESINFECPRCGAYQETVASDKLIPKYCSYCGQKLDLGV